MNAFELESERTCPVCKSESFVSTEETFDLGEILRRWEQEDRIRFTDSVWAHYTEPAAPQITLRRCVSCAFAQFEPLFPGTSDFYECITVSDGSCYTADKWEFLQAIKDIKKHGAARVLDIGAGSGYFLDLLRQSLPDVESAGFEFNKEMASLVSSKGHRMYYGSFPDVLLNESLGQSFDVVCMFQVIEHVAEPIRLIRIGQQCLKRNGLLIMAVPDNSGPVKFFPKALTDLPPHHVSRWRASSFKLGLPRLGLEVVRISHEPLTSQVWELYLPAILEHTVLPRTIVQQVNKNKRLIRVFNQLHIKSLRGVRGHSLYVVARNLASS